MGMRVRLPEGTPRVPLKRGLEAMVAWFADDANGSRQALTDRIATVAE